jgi:hypothetical protein
MVKIANFRICKPNLKNKNKNSNYNYTLALGGMSWYLFWCYEMGAHDSSSINWLAAKEHYGT